MTIEEVQNKAIHTYNQNIEYLRLNHPELHKNVELFNTAIDLQQIKTNFDLEFINGYFDIKSTQNSQFLYNQNSDQISQKLAENVNFDMNSNTFKCFYEYNYNDKMAKEGLESDILGPYTRGNAPIVNYINKNSPKVEVVNNIEKFIIFGVLLGMHIQHVHEKLKSKVYLIVEPNLEFFRLSLFTTNYAQIAGESKIFFSIAQNEIDFRNTFDSFYGEFFILNHYLKFMNISDSCDLYIKTIQNFLVSQAHYLYAYDRTFMSIFRTNKYISDNYKLLNIDGKKELKGFEKPILMLAAGPSLQHNIKFVRENKDKFTIVAIYATLPILERHGIVPDIITQYDEQDIQVLNTLDKLTNPSFFNDSIFIFSSHVNAKLTNTFPKEKIFFFQAMFEIKEGFGMLTSPSIGELTYALLLKLGAKNIYLLGLDLALDVETGASHMEGHSGSGAFSKLKSEEESSDKNYSFRKNTIKIKGNFLDEVKSVPVFKSNIDTFATFTQLYKDSSIKVYNLSNGAFLYGAEPLHIENINLGNLQKAENLYEVLLSISELGYNKSDEEKHNLKLSSVKKIKKTIDQFWKIKKYKNLEEYKNNLINTVHNILFEKHHCEDLKSILLNYSWHNLHYIFHFLNLKDLDTSKNYVYEINKALCTQLDKIVNTYTICISYSDDENSSNIKKLNKYIKEYNVKDSIYSEPFLKELAETAKKTVQNEFKEKCIGMFAFEDNLQNKEFVQYVKDICKKVEDSSIKLFYFFEIQKISAQTIFKQELSKIEFIHPKEIIDITSNVEFWLETSEKTLSLVKVNDLVLNNFDNLYSSMQNEKSQELNKDTTFKSNFLTKINNDHFIKNTAYYKFANSFKEKLDEEKFLELYEKGTIGLLGVRENIQKEFIENIFKIFNKFPELKLKIFYFDEEIKQEFSIVFIQLLSKIQFIIPNSIYDIATNCEIWTQAKIKNQSLLHSKIFGQLQDFTLNIYPLILNDEFKFLEHSDYKSSIIEKYDEKSFAKQLNGNLDVQRLQNTNPEDYIGFLATEDNLEDKDFLQLMFILLEKHPEIKFKAFYFNDEQKELFGNIFSEFLERFELIIPKDIYELTENISTYIYSFIKGKKLKTQTYHKVWGILNQRKANLFKIHLYSEILLENKYLENLKLIDDSKISYTNLKIYKIIKNHKDFYEFKFLNQINNTYLTNNIDMYCPNSIGFFVNSENTTNTKFLDYLVSLIKTLDTVSFKIFYFTDTQKEFILKLKKDYQNIELIKTDSSKDIIKNVEILITNTTSCMDRLFYAKHELIFNNIFMLNFTANRFNLDDFNETIINTEKFINSITENTSLTIMDINLPKNGNTNPYKIQFELTKLLKIKINEKKYFENFYEYVYSDLIKNILENPEIKRLYLNQKKYRDK